MKKSLKPAGSDFIQDKNLSSVCAFRVLLVLTQLFIFSGGRLHLSTLVFIPKVHVKTVQKGKSILGVGWGQSILPWARHQECAGREPAKRKSLLEKRPRIQFDLSPRNLPAGLHHDGSKKRKRSIPYSGTAWH